MSGYIGATAVGLTTTAADVQGDITSTDTTPELILKNTSEEDTEGGREGKITFKGEQSGGEESTLAQIESAHDGTSDDQKGDLIFKTNDGSDGASPTERVRIDSSGRIGIGTSDASSNTSTYYDDLVIKNDTSGSGAGITIQSNTTNGFGGVDFRKADGSQVGKIFAGSSNGHLVLETGGTSALRIDDSQNVKIGTGTSIDTSLHVENSSGTTLVKTEVASGSVVGYDIQKTGSTTQHWRIADGVVANGQLEVYDQTNSKSMMAISTSGVVFNEDANDRDFRVESDSNDHAFAVDGAGYGTVKMGGSSVFSYGQTSGNGTFGYAIDNGSSYGSLMLSNNADRGWALCYANKFAYSSGDDRRLFALNINGGAVGNIQTNSAGTAIEFNGTSDRRVKENITDLANGIETVKQLRPRAFEWITDEDTVFPANGFIADEADGVIPEWVTGEANAVDEDNNPIYQTMDYSKAVPVLTAALKEAITKIETLETQNTTQATQIADLITRVEALEGA